MKPHIAVPCHEDWDKMKIGVLSRHCAVCQKNVMDFTQLSRAEMLQYLLEHRNQNVCGRAYKHQFDITHEETLVVIKNLESKHRNTNLSFYLLSMATLTLLSCEPENNFSGIKKGVGKTKIELKKGNSIASSEIQKEATVLPSHVERIEEYTTVEYPVTGDMAIIPVPPPIEEHSTLGEMVIEVVQPSYIAEIMPEFPGGTDSLMLFIKQRLTYPKWEKRNKIQGTVYVQFTVDTTGEILNPKILKSVEGSRHFDKEVMRVLKEMPKWKPGSTNGKRTAVQFNLPFKFEL